MRRLLGRGALGAVVALLFLIPNAQPASAAINQSFDNSPRVQWQPGSDDWTIANLPNSSSFVLVRQYAPYGYLSRLCIYRAGRWDSSSADGYVEGYILALYGDSNGVCQLSNVMPIDVSITVSATRASVYYGPWTDLSGCTFTASDSDGYASGSDGWEGNCTHPTENVGGSTYFTDGWSAVRLQASWDGGIPGTQESTDYVFPAKICPTTQNPCS